MVAVVQIRVADGTRAAGALRNVLPGHLQMDAARMDAEVKTLLNTTLGGYSDDYRGTVRRIITGTLDYGQGHATPFAQVMSEQLGVPCYGTQADLTLDGKRLAVIHGDDGRVKQTLLAAQEHDYLFQGHTHVADDTHHLDPTWVMGYDLDPIRCIDERKRLLAPQADVPQIHYYFPQARLRGYEGDQPDAAERRDFDAVVYPGYPVRSEAVR